MMGKDREYLQSIIQRRIDNLPNGYEGLYIEGSRDAYDLVLQDIKELDEPEVLSQEWIDEHAMAVTYDGILDQTEIVYVDELENLLVPKQDITEEQVMDWLDKNDFYDHITAETVLERAVDKGELSYYGTKYSVIETPTVPKYVDEWITKHRDTFDLYPVLKRLEDNPSTWRPTYKWYRTNTRDFVNAYLTGDYKVEEEQKYYVKIMDKCLTDKGLGIGTTFDVLYTSGEKMGYQQQFTEQEIKGYDERFWPFAEPVEELEE